jgi:hypothetical protein
MPISYDILKVQAIEFNDQVRKSAYSFEVIDNQLRLFPVPTRAGYMRFEYYKVSEKQGLSDNANTAAAATGGTPITNISNGPYTNPTFTQINTPGREWIYRYTLALAKELLAYIRGKYTTVPIPGSDATLNQADLLAEMGLIGTFFGLETMHPESAKSIGKGLAPSKVKDRLYWLADRWKNKVNISAGFILGLPHDDIFYFDELAEWCLEKDNPLQHIEFYPLYLFNHKVPGDRKPYLSEFSLNPEIYGYIFNGLDNYSNWKLPQQNLNFDICLNISQSYNKLVSPRNKYSAFSMMLFLNVGVTLEDLLALTMDQIHQKYNISALNDVKLNEYKKMLGIDQLINTKNISKDR